MHGATRSVRHAAGNGTISGWRDVRPTGTRVVAAQESMREIEEPVRVGVGVIIYEGYDLTVCSLCAGVARAVRPLFSVRITRGDSDGLYGLCRPSSRRPPLLLRSQGSRASPGRSNIGQ